MKGDKQTDRRTQGQTDVKVEIVLNVTNFAYLVRHLAVTLLSHKAFIYLRHFFNPLIWFRIYEKICIWVCLFTNTFHKIVLNNPLVYGSDILSLEVSEKSHFLLTFP